MGLTCHLDYGEGLRHLNRQEDWLKTAVISKNRILSKTECRWHCLYIDNIDANEFQLTICHDALEGIDAKVQKCAYGFLGAGDVLGFMTEYISENFEGADADTVIQLHIYISL